MCDIGFQFDFPTEIGMFIFQTCSEERIEHVSNIQDIKSFIDVVRNPRTNFSDHLLADFEEAGFIPDESESNINATSNTNEPKIHLKAENSDVPSDVLPISNPNPDIAELTSSSSAESVSLSSSKSPSTPLTTGESSDRNNTIEADDNNKNIPVVSLSTESK